MATVTITKPTATTTTANNTVTVVALPVEKEAYKPAPGRLGNLSAAQATALETLKAEIQTEGWFVDDRMDDAMLLRFLRARKFDVPLAKKMLQECEQWRIDFGIEELMRSFEFTEREEVSKYYPQFYHGMDKDGQPVYIERLGTLNVKALYAATTVDRCIKQLVYDYERFLTVRAPACSRAVGRPIETTCTILDLGGVKLTNFVNVRDYVAQAVAIGQNRYPECMGKFYIINAPWAFNAIWRLIRPWLDQVTQSKVEILDHNYQKKLHEQIPKAQLPKFFGGLCECPGGCSLSDCGPWKEPEVTIDEKVVPVVVA